MIYELVIVRYGSLLYGSPKVAFLEMGHDNNFA